MPDHNRGRARVLVLAVLFLCQLPAADHTEFFEKRIRPVLVRSCYPCHSRATAKPMGGIRLDTSDETRRILGPVGDSRLLQAISYNGKIKMPPAGKLSADEIADFTEWIRSGAPDPRDEAQPETHQLWSLRPIQDPTPPAVQSAWAQSPADAFILAKLESRGLTPAPPAGKRTLIRRVTYDLTGLPPTPAEVAAFLADTSPQAFEHVVDRLLASPQYGERWARHWLDLVRYAETNGHEYDNEKLTPWRYRDYVIRAFNQDIPYNQFVREHIAGDLLPKKRVTADGAAMESPLGTTFLWFGEVLNSATDPVKSRADEVDNQIDVAGKAFLGLTVACARCHDHKFDPIPTADYYALAGVLHSTGMREDVIDSPRRAQAIQDLSRQIRAANPALARLKPQTHYRPQDAVFENFDDPSFTKWTVAGAAFGDAADHGRANSLAGGDDRFVGTLISAKFRTGGKLYLHVRISGTPADPKLNERGLLRFTLVSGEYKAQHIVPSGPQPVWKTMTLTLERNRVCYFEIVDRSTAGHIAVDQIVFSDLKDPPQTDNEAPLPEAPASAAPIPPSEFAMIAADSEPHNVKIHIRGSHENLGAEVPRGFLRAIAGSNQRPITTGSGRLQVAGWFAGDDNPLTARVMVNRIWKHHFGAGLVRTPDNFGGIGEAPSNPELLDWLATRFIQSGWSVKAMHRLMLLSSAYQMSSRAAEAAATADPENKLLHHMPVQRLEPEAIRDAILTVAGTLDPQLYGPSIPPYISKYQNGRGKPESGPLDGAGRRSIYIQVRRNFLPSLFLAFDYPLPISSIGARSVSTVPSQALLMMNNEFVAQQAGQWARRAMAATDSPPGRVDYLYETAFSRLPTPDERNEVLRFVQGAANPSQGWSDAAHVLLNSAEFIYVQ